MNKCWLEKDLMKSKKKLLSTLNTKLIILNQQSSLTSKRFYHSINFFIIIMSISHQQFLQFYNHLVSFSKQLFKYYIFMLIADNVQQHTSFQFFIHVSFNKTFNFCHKNNIDDFTICNTFVSIVISFFRLSLFKFLIFNRSFVIFAVSSNVRLFFFNNHNISLSSFKFFSNLIFEKVSNELHEINFFSFNNFFIVDILELNSNEKNFMLNNFDEQFAIDTFYEIDVVQFSLIISSFTKHFEHFVSTILFENSTFQSFFFKNFFFSHDLVLNVFDSHQLYFQWNLYHFSNVIINLVNFQFIFQDFLSSRLNSNIEHFEKSSFLHFRLANPNCKILWSTNLSTIQITFHFQSCFFNQIMISLDDLSVMQIIRQKKTFQNSTILYRLHNLATNLIQQIWLSWNVCFSTQQI